MYFLLQNLLEVKLEPEEYPEDGMDAEDDNDQPPPPPPEVSFMEQQPEVTLRNVGCATSSTSLPSVFLPQQTTSEKTSHNIIPRRNSHEKTSSAANLQPEFPQDPSCKGSICKSKIIISYY